MPAPLPVDWNEVKTLSIAIGVREAARRMGLGESAVMQRCAREGWLAKRNEAKVAMSPAGKAQTLADAHGLHVSSVSKTPSAAEILSSLGPDSKSKLAIAGNRAVTRLAEMDGDELIVPEVAQTAKTWASTLATAHSWEKEGSGGNAVVNITFLGAQDQPVTIDVDTLPEGQE